MTANKETRKEVWWQKDQERYPDLTKFKNFASWDEALSAFDPNKISVEAALGILHSMAQHIGSNINDSFRRIAFYLHCAENGGEGLSEFYGQKKFHPQYDIRSKAYDCLISSPGEMLHNDLIRYAITLFGCSSIAESYENYKAFVELLKMALDFFSRPGNRPTKPEHKKKLASFLNEVFSLRFEHNVFFSIFFEGDTLLSQDFSELDNDAKEIKEKAIKAAVNCRLYELIVGKKLFETMDPLLEMVLQEERTSFPLFVFNCLNEATGDIKKNVLATILQLRLREDSAANTWIILWAMKNAPEEKPTDKHKFDLESGGTSGVGV